MSASEPPMQKIKEAMRATWMAGDFGAVAKANMGWAEAFVASLGIPAGARVLDVACGTGNLAIPLARGKAVVTGVDIATNLLAQARERAATEDLSATFDEGDAEQLPYADGAFDAVVTMFGAMFAPRPELVAAEFARVLRPGGLLAMGNWTPSSFPAQMSRAGARYIAPPPGVAPPVLWGDAATVQQRLASAFTDIRTEPIAVEFDMPFPPAGAVQFFRKYFGPVHMTFAQLDEAGQSAFAADLESLWSQANVAPDPASRTMLRTEYLRVTARRNGA